MGAPSPSTDGRLAPMSRPALPPAIRTVTRPALVVALAGLALALSACSSSDEAPEAEAAPTVLQAGAPGESSRPVDPGSVPTETGAAHTEADVEFVTDMVGHHAQAVMMTSMVADRSDDPELEEFVLRMDVSQVAEIEQMQRWLEARDEEVPAWDPVFGAQGGHPDGMAGMDMGGEQMPGMASQAQLDALEAASGEEFDRLFLQTMTAHHQGALAMTDELFAAGGGEENEVFQIASHVVADQGIELERMAAMLAELGA